MEPEKSNPNVPDSGLMCLVTAARLLGIPADYQQLKRTFLVTETTSNTVIMLRRELGVRLRRELGVRLALLH